MHDTAILSELRGALRRQGVWGLRAERLMQDWQEHVEEETARRVEQGVGPEAAREAAWQALGSPNVLAVKAGCELASGSWLGRHPWAGGVLLPMAAWLALILAMGLFFWGIMELFNTWDANSNTTTLHVLLTSFVVTINWLPWLTAMAWLARIALRMPGGWKLYWITANALTAFASSVLGWVQWPQHGTQSGGGPIWTGNMNVQLIGLPGAAAKVALEMFGYGATTGTWEQYIRGMCLHPLPLIQTATMALGAVAFYGRMTGGYRRAATRPGAIALFLSVALVGSGYVLL